MRFVEEALERAFGKAGVRVQESTAVAGGSIHEARHVSTSEGAFFVKWSARCPRDIFLCEAAGLEALRSATDDLGIPRVITAAEPVGDDPAFLILEYLEPASRDSVPDDERLGRGLAALHRNRAARFGFDSPSYCGLTRQENSWRDSWVDFFRDQRVSLSSTLSRASEDCRPRTGGSMSA